MKIKKKLYNIRKKQQEILSDYIEIIGEIIGIMDGCFVEKMKETEIIKDVNPDIDINENNETNNRQKEENKKEEKYNDISDDD